MNIHLIWFRNDLRLHDHGPLDATCRAAKADGGVVLPFYVVDPHWFGDTRFGFPRMASHRRRFLQESLDDLATNLRTVGVSLSFLSGSTDKAISRLIETVGPVSLRFHHEFGVEERAIEQRVVAAAERQGVTCTAFSPSTLLNVEDLPFDIDDTPEVFTKYRRIVEKNKQKRCQPREPIAAPTSVPSDQETIDQVASLTLNDAAVEVFSDSSETPRRGDPCVLDFHGGETAGLKRLRDYLWTTDSIARYKETRNGMLGIDYSSKFSPWLANGCVSARQIAAEVSRYENERVANESTYWMIFELLWRDYFALMVAKHGAAVFQITGLRGQSYPWKQDHPRFEIWAVGQTGFPLIDANMRELSATGFMSNRGRQNVGSFLTKNLGIDWRMGAEWFESQLIDYDPCSNYGNWNYVAGVGNDARGFRWFNTIKQSHNYDAGGSYVRHWCPELTSVPDQWVHEPWKMSTDQQKQSGCVIGVDYPAPIVDLFQSADHHQRLYEEGDAHG